MNRNGNSAIFFSYVYNSKIIKELFASTLNGLSVKVICVSFTTVDGNAKLLDWLWRRQTKRNDGERKNLK